MASTTVKMAGSKCTLMENRNNVSSGGISTESNAVRLTASRRTRVAKLKIQEFAEEKEDKGRGH
jgi:hypothetical protein